MKIEKQKVMSKLEIKYPSGATPIDPDEAHQLIPDYISTIGELNQLEQANIADGLLWASKQNGDNLLSATFIFRLHKEIFGQVWRWAGHARTSNKNIGVMKENIMNSLGQLLKDTQYWIDHKTFESDELAARFHHRLVQIHIFPNGNGRHARLMTDLLLKKLGADKFSWGLTKADTQLETEGKIRSEYIDALKKADQDDFGPLIKFARS